MLNPQTLPYLVYALAAATAVLLVEVLYLQFVARRRRKAINRRLGKLADNEHQQAALRTLLQERGLTASGDYLFGVVWLNRIYAQSGITGNPIRFFSGFAVAGVAIGALCMIFGVAILVAVLVCLLVGLALPLLYLQRARRRRLRVFERQLPDALDMIVRSLKAGHPTSVAVGLVGREMSDPVGTEFGIVSDEITFGAQMETAVRRMAERVGFEGLQLLSVALGIQSQTGGNLAEILDNLSRTLRSRLILRMKVRSLASEGKMSAMIMSVFPLAMLVILLVVSPSYYGGIWGDPLIVPVFAVFGVWALFGDFIMYRMVNFDF